MRAGLFKAGGLLNICKPSGPTSFQIVKRIRDILDEKKVGHCGTLDPAASGVLVVLFGNETCRSEEFMNREKVYKGSIQLGSRTDTGDLSGKILETKIFEPPPLEKIQSVFSQFIGELKQETPIFSAAKFRGRKLYEYARKGIAVPKIIRQVTIFSLDLVSYQSPLIEFRVGCSKGTYVRTLAEDIGAALGIPAVLSELTRERVGEFCLEKSLSWEKIEGMSRDELLRYSA